MFWLALVTVAIAAALAVPLHLDVKLELADRFRARARVRWLFDLVNVQIGGATSAETATAPAPPRAPTPTRKRARGRRFMAVLDTPGLRPRVIRFAGDLLRRIHVDRFTARARYGFADPADTGQMCGALAPMLALASAGGLDVLCTPDFGGAVVAGRCDGTVTVRPLSVAAVVIAFGCSPPVWRAIHAWRRAS